MYIELSSGDLVKSSSGKIFEILSLRNYGRGYLTVVLINRDTCEDFEVEFCDFKTEYKLLTDFDVSKQYVEGKHEGIKEGYNYSYNKGFEDGKVVKVREIENLLKTEAWKEGYDQCICDLIEEGVLEGTDEEYSEYKFGAVEDDEEEYCFSKELDKVKEGGCVFILDGKVVGDRIKDSNNLAEYHRGYEDGKSRGITLGYNKRDYEESRVGSIDGSERKHSHYFKDVRHLDYVDIYQVCKLFEVEDSSHCTQHSIKKLLMSGKRGAKDKIKDITEARDTLSRYLQIEGYE